MKQNPNKGRWATTTLLFALLAVIRPPAASPTDPLQTLFPTLQVNGQSFGHSVAMSGSTIVVGLPHIGFSSATGTATVFDLSGSNWEKTTDLTSWALGAGSLFGWSVAMDGDTIVVGARYGNNPSIPARTGNATVFERAGGVWSTTDFLLSPHSSTGDQFGTSVSVSEDTIVVGAPFEGTCGKAYVYDKGASGWNHSHTLEPATCTVAQRFGSAVAIDTFAEDWYVVAVGDQGDPGLGAGAGAVHVFLRLDGVWFSTPVVTGADTQEGDAFGASLALSDLTLVVGAPGDDDLGSSSGSVYVFQTGAYWAQKDKVTAQDGRTLADFGAAVAVAGDAMVVGAPGANVSSGAVYLFEAYGDFWHQSARLNAATPYGGEHFGRSVAVSGAVMVGGAPSDDEFRPGAGSARIFGGLNLLFADGFEGGDTDDWSSTS